MKKRKKIKMEEQREGYVCMIMKRLKNFENKNGKILWLVKRGLQLMHGLKNENLAKVSPLE